MATSNDTPSSLLLFDPNTEQPPADAVEIYLEAPRSLGVFYDAATEAKRAGKGHHHDALIQGIQRIQNKAANVAMEVIQREGGYTKVGYHAHVGHGQPTIGKYLPASLYMTDVFEDLADERSDIPRLHEHIYVGGHGLVADDGEHWPVDLGSLQNVVSVAQVHYADTWEKLTTDAIGVAWRTVPELGSVEIVDPPMYEHVGKYPHVMCAGPFRVRQRWISRDVMSPEESRHAV